MTQDEMRDVVARALGLASRQEEIDVDEIINEWDRLVLQDQTKPEEDPEPDVDEGAPV